MNELLKVNLNENQEPIISGRELHKVLEVKTKYKDWFLKMVEYGFVENIDYTAINQKRLTAQGNETTDHVLKLDMAKEIAMLQRNEKGKQIRQYFIEVEKEYNSPEKIMARALMIANKQVTTLKISNHKLSKENEKLNKKIILQESKVLFAEAVLKSEISVSIGDLAKILKQNGLDIGKNRLVEVLKRTGYLLKNNIVGAYTPTQKSMNLELFEITESINKYKVSKTILVTGKGQLYFINKFINKNRNRVIEKVDINYVCENIDKEYYINYEEVRKNILEKFKNDTKINEAIEDINLYIDTIKSKGEVSEILSGEKIFDFFHCIKFSLRKLEKSDITVGLIAC